MSPELRECQNCKNQFAIEPADFTFYEKMQVPPPTWCPECRLIRRYAWRNERSLFKAKCSNCGRDIFSGYHPDSPFPVFCRDCWFSDAWDPLDYGRDYDFSRPFFEQFGELFAVVPRLNLFQINPVNSPYSNIVRDVKNTYLSYSIVVGEEIYYSKNVDASREMYDCFAMENSERCFNSSFGEGDYGVAHSVLTSQSLESAFLFDCTNADNCFMSSNLRRQKYILRNRQLSKEEYEAERRKIDTGSYAVVSDLQKEFWDLQYKYPRKYAEILRSTNATGNVLANVKNSKDCFECYNLEDVYYSGRVFGMKDSMDTNNIPGGELIYEYISGGSNDRNLKFSIASIGSLSDSIYSGWCGTSSNLFGCFGIRGKQHCILNRQYGEAEYKELVPKIIQHMSDMPYQGKNGRMYSYGEFFPIELSPFAYNEATVQEQFPLPKEEIIARNYNYREQTAKNPTIDILAIDLPDHIKDTPADITSKTIGCLHAGKCLDQCTMAFRVIPQELEVYKRMNFPLPRLCPNCRHYERVKFRNPWKLWQRKCHCAGAGSENGIYKNTAMHFHGEAPCPNEFETSYAPGRPETVYCEQCYNAEVV